MDPVTGLVLYQAAKLGLEPVKTACSLAEKLLSRPCEVAGELAANYLIEWRNQNTVETLVRLQAILAEQGVEPQNLPPAFVLPALDAIRDVDDERLREMWANLLASAVGCEGNRSIAFVDTLKALTPAEAIMLNYVLKHDLEFASFAGKESRLITGVEYAALGLSSDEEFEMTLDRLIGKGLLCTVVNLFEDVAYNKKSKMMPSSYGIWFGDSRPPYGGCIVEVSLSTFGAAFARACIETNFATEMAEPSWMREEREIRHQEETFLRQGDLKTIR